MHSHNDSPSGCKKRAKQNKNWGIYVLAKLFFIISSIPTEQVWGCIKCRDGFITSVEMGLYWYPFNCSGQASSSNLLNRTLSDVFFLLIFCFNLLLNRKMFNEHNNPEIQTKNNCFSLTIHSKHVKIIVEVSVENKTFFLQITEKCSVQIKMMLFCKILESMCEMYGMQF